VRSSHEIDVIDERAAHDFVWQHIQRPWDLCVYELDDTPAHQFIHAYLVNYPGVVVLRSADIATLRVPLLASRCIVVAHDSLAELLRAMYPDVHVRYAPPRGGPTGSAPLNEQGDAGSSGPRSTGFAVVDRRTDRADVVERAFRRARDAGATFDVLRSDPTLRTLARADVVIAPGWPPFRDSAPVLAAMAAGKAVVTMEMETTADWPALDPQTWRPRGVGTTGAPIAVTIDPRDEEHSLMLAIRRLSIDAGLREALGRAARGWCEQHVNPQHAVAAWSQILQEAVTLSPPPRPDDWPTGRSADGTELARSILGEFGLRSDL